MIMDARMPNEHGTNNFNYAIDGYAWSGASGNNSTISREAGYGSFPLHPEPDNPTVMKFNPTGNSSYTYTYHATANNIAVATNGETWTFSFWARQNSLETNLSISAFIFEAQSNGNYLTFSHDYFTCHNYWERFSMTRTFNQASANYIQVRFDGPATHPGGTPYILFDGMQVEEASSASTFTMNGPYYLKDLVLGGNTEGSSVSFETTNTNSSSYPNTSTPHEFNEWYSYDHDAAGTPATAQILLHSNGSDPGSADSYLFTEQGWQYSSVYRVVITDISGNTAITGNNSDIYLAASNSNPPTNYETPGSISVSSSYSTFYFRVRIFIEDAVGTETTTITVTPAGSGVTTDSISINFEWSGLF